MKVYCLRSFPVTLSRLAKKNSYRDIEQVVFEKFTSNDFDFFSKSGVNLVTGGKVRYVKLRLRGRGGYRLVYYAIISGGKIYLATLYPKTGSLGRGNLEAEEVKDYLREMVNAVKTNNVLLVEFEKEKKALVFHELEKV